MSDMKGSGVSSNAPEIVYEVQSQRASVDEDGHLVRRLAFNLDTADYGEAMSAYLSESVRHDGRTVMLFVVTRARNADGHIISRHALWKVNWDRIAPQENPKVVPVISGDAGGRDGSHALDTSDKAVSQAFERGFLDAVASAWHEGFLGADDAASLLDGLANGSTYSYDAARHATCDEFVLGALRAVYAEHGKTR